MESVFIWIGVAIVLISLIGGPIVAQKKEETRVMEYCQRVGVVIIQERIFTCAEKKQ